MIIEIDLGRNKCHYPTCDPFIGKWSEWCKKHEAAPLALLPITADYHDEALDGKSRNMIRKAAKYYYYHTFYYNLHIEDIYRINTSTAERQGKPMTVAYLTKPTPIMVPDDLCNTQHRYVFIGGFNSSDELKAYAALAVVGQIGILNTIIGHVENLSSGIMNGLIDYLVSYLHRTSSCIYLNYLDMHNCTPGLRAFKDSVGFAPLRVSFVY